MGIVDVEGGVECHFWLFAGESDSQRLGLGQYFAAAKKS